MSISVVLRVSVGVHGLNLYSEKEATCKSIEQDKSH